MGVASSDGCNYSLAVTDFKYRFVMHDVLPTKDAALKSFRRFLATVRALDHKIEHVRLDSDSVFMGREFMAVLDDHGVSRDFSAPYSHVQHGRMERQWGTRVQVAKSMLYTAGLDRFFGVWLCTLRCTFATVFSVRLLV
jgi:transposase InsO family protein